MLINIHSQLCIVSYHQRVTFGKLCFGENQLCFKDKNRSDTFSGLFSLFQAKRQKVKGNRKQAITQGGFICLTCIQASTNANLKYSVTSIQQQAAQASIFQGKLGSAGFISLSLIYLEGFISKLV